jgi:hypothetical protein
MLVTSRGLITDGTAFYSPPIKGFCTLEDFLHHGLMEGLRHHRLVDLIPRHLPRGGNSWHLLGPNLIVRTQFLNPEIRVTDNMTFCFENVYVTMDPWVIEGVLQLLSHQGTDIQHWLESYLQILDVEYAIADATRLAAPLELLGIIRHPDMERVAALLRQSIVAGNTLWHRRGDHRVTRYLTSHNLVDPDL